jgi:3-hydroxymyristoyl/3-hydroxydecanoyl-(acyl carrier protein) dehydratase
VTAEEVREPDVLDQRIAGAHAELLLHIPETLAYFTGHFPGFAILPGVVQLDWVMLFARRLLSVSPTATTRKMRVKFAKPIRPGADITLTLDYAATGHRLRFEYRDPQSFYGSGRIELGDDGV